ncbi:MAG: hypothetical protein IPK81_23290 [Rhodospirillales bacterium]|nr:MAG: hypothetical protein IPK81_23290 [Rhodospirillales bacterium]
MRRLAPVVSTGLAALLLAAAVPALAQRGPGSSMDRSSELLDNLVRRMKLCAEIPDPASRASCYDRIDTGAGAPPAGGPAASTGPERSYDPSKVGKDDKPLTSPDDRAFDPRNPGSTVGAAPGVILPGQGPVSVEPQWRRVGSVPIRAVPGASVPVVALELPALRPGPDYRWQLSMLLSNNTPRILDVVINCRFNNGDRMVSDVTVTMRSVRGGDKVAAEISGPPTTQFVDNAPCNVVSPLQ